jgi:hypothetical protein
MPATAATTVHSLSHRLANLPRDRFKVPPEKAKQVFGDYDYEFSEAISGKLAVCSRDGSVEIKANKPLGNGPGCYLLDVGSRKIEFQFQQGFGGHIASFAHYEFAIREGSRVIGTADCFPNINFVFTNREPCNRLSIFKLDDETFYHYRADIKESWWKVTPYSITLDARYELVAQSASDSAVFTRGGRLKTFRDLSELHIGMLLVADASLTRD